MCDWYIKEGKDGKDGEIVIYWVSDGGDTKSLYWAGTYVAPKDNKETYSWTSKNNKDKTDHALLASGDDTKVFTYEKGEITYKASALGTTKKMHFVRTDTNYCDEEDPSEKTACFEKIVIPLSLSNAYVSRKASL